MIVPAPVLPTQDNQLRILPYSSTHSLSFHQAFGWMGVPMLLLALACMLWTTWLIILTIAPNATANYLMNTEAFDNGTFWLIINPEPVLMIISVMGLGIVAFGYAYVLALMTVLRNQKRREGHSPLRNKRLQTLLSQRKMIQIRHRWLDVTGFHARYRKYWNLWLKSIDLVVQTVTLYQYLNRGCPALIVYGFAGLISTNAAVYASGLLTPRHLTAFSEVIIDSVFDLLVAVVFPILVLAYCYSNFQLDRAVILLNLKVYPPGSFEQGARDASDPAQTALFRLMFDSLRIQSGLDFVLRISMNLSFCYRFKRVTEMAIESKRSLVINPDDKASFGESSDQAGHVVVSQRSLPRALALLPLVFSVLVLSITHKAIRTSKSHCSHYPECVAYAYKWSTEPLCPCIVLIDADRSPKTFQEWIEPKNVTDTVAALATAGDLRVLQIINRHFADWPEELKRCRSLQYLSLIYTGVESIPTWAGGFHKLEFLHVEGKEGEANLLQLPENLFAAKKQLTFVHLSTHLGLSALPLLQGLTNLQVLILVLVGVQELPSFQPLRSLERLEMSGLLFLPTIPDLAPLTRLQSLTIFERGMFCCNGFLGSACNLSHPYCDPDPLFMLPPATCLNASTSHASASTLAVMRKFSSSVCQPVASTSVEFIDKAQVDLCQGMMYRQCPANALGFAGICSSERMQVIMCIHDPFVITMRREQIRLGIGPRCNKVEEAWLGCNT